MLYSVDRNSLDIKEIKDGKLEGAYAIVNGEKVKRDHAWGYYTEDKDEADKVLQEYKKKARMEIRKAISYHKYMVENLQQKLRDL